MATFYQKSTLVAISFRLWADLLYKGILRESLRQALHVVCKELTGYPWGLQGGGGLLGLLLGAKLMSPASSLVVCLKFKLDLDVAMQKWPRKDEIRHHNR